MLMSSFLKHTMMHATIMQACYNHASMNVVAKFKTDHTGSEIYNATYSFQKSKLHRHFKNIKLMDPAIE